MKEILIKIRNSILRFFYKVIFKPIFFQVDPEKVHDKMIKFGHFLGTGSFTKSLTALFFSYRNKKLEQKILGIKFNNPLGLAAGFDKNAEMTEILPRTGFGFGEIGSITGEQCKGNPKPRLWRLKKSKGLVVYYGLKNEGCEKIANKLEGKKLSVPIGISIAKTNSKKTVKLEAGIKDYVKAFKTIKNIGDFAVINISCPNTFGGTPFTQKEDLEKLLTETGKIKYEKPVFIKLPPDLTKKQIDETIKVTDRHIIDGFVCTNLTKDRENKTISRKIHEKNIPEVGGVSGKPIEELADETIKYIYKKTKGKYTIIGCGGIFSAEDAYKKIRLGASLIQQISGMIFEGPQLMSEINQGLVKLLEKDGFNNISEAVGIDNQF
ncbi:quinone-dependent dihydroorotate dehydrogenase [Candidatus Peregrinibacteria bacterium]|nr:quinone-dependent dihydroorotate dehydrogenase [Candidatus Peregrinibacteria bacterium]